MKPKKQSYQFKVGDRVKLISTRHGIDNYNPVWGKYQGPIDTIGKIIRINSPRKEDSEILEIDVEWTDKDNTYFINEYAPIDLELYEEYKELEWDK
jgi:hypothetical protein